MTAEPAPAPPPWRRGEAPSVDERNAYEIYLLREIKIRDLKHATLMRHIETHCR